MQGNIKTRFERLWYDLNVCLQQINALNTKIAMLYVLLQEDTYRNYKIYSRAGP